MSVPSLASLVKVDLHEAWDSEPHDFTPWLAQPDNIRLLGEAIGLELEVESQEKEVGPFRADILCKDTVTDHWVLIENQLERTDHTHLGQLLTYAAGLDAVTIVWIAARFTEEHRAALDWLNEISEERFNFFGLEVELWRIGDSAMAPKFNVVCKPNDWARSVKTSAERAEAGTLSETRQTQLAFWVRFCEFMEGRSNVRCQKPGPYHYMRHGIGRSGFWLASIASAWDSEAGTYSGEIRVELVIGNPDAKAFFELLKAERADIERDAGEALTWYSQEGTTMCRIYARQSADINNREDWPRQHEWLRQRLEAFHRVFAPRVRMLDAADYQAQPASEGSS